LLDYLKGPISQLDIGNRVFFIPCQDLLIGLEKTCDF
jgi:hypothetical protein